jgi:hypothetical protein
VVLVPCFLVSGSLLVGRFSPFYPASAVECSFLALFWVCLVLGLELLICLTVSKKMLMS